ncbi:hypothetical protein JM658_07565 [Joostella atrarenae]|uniref:LAGLIDADG homing endonuclease n=1 Tax=Joostella atrarenae TaxID=679257 RepID=A0ABS9J2M2_9FLAO|nr:hypothetical protein [Joostella atrarenae]MCF8714685.1 hypothetical protein [Joostella atrarenae]
MIKTYKNERSVVIMQSVQLQNVGILLSKKGITVLDYGSNSKVFVKYKTKGSVTKCKYIFPYLADLIHAFYLGMEPFVCALDRLTFPVPIAIGMERGNVMESKKWGLCPRLF